VVSRRAYPSASASRLLALVVAFFLLVRRAAVLARVRGESMMPTLEPGDYLLGLQVPPSLALRRFLLGRGAVVLVRPPAHLGRLEVKRIVGVAGDIRRWGYGAAAIGPQHVPRDHIFLTGDAAAGDGFRRGMAADSRQYGPCPTSAIVAWVLLRYWPIGRIGFIIGYRRPLPAREGSRRGRTPPDCEEYADA